MISLRSLLAHSIDYDGSTGEVVINDVDYCNNDAGDDVDNDGDDVDNDDDDDDDDDDDAKWGLCRAMQDMAKLYNHAKWGLCRAMQDTAKLYNHAKWEL